MSRRNSNKKGSSRRKAGMIAHMERREFDLRLKLERRIRELEDENKALRNAISELKGPQEASALSKLARMVDLVSDAVIFSYAPPYTTTNIDTERFRKEIKQIIEKTGCDSASIISTLGGRDDG